MIKGAIFDYGDTLVRHRIPFEAILPKAIRETYFYLKKKGLKTSFEDYVRINGAVFGEFSDIEIRENRDISDSTKYDELVVRLFPTRSEPWRKRTAKSADRAFHDAGARYRTVAPGARAGLDELKSMKLRMAVLSNHSDQRALIRSLKQFKLESYFLQVYSSSELGVRKPDPSIFEVPLAALKLRADQTIFVGDSLENDIAGAKARGMTTVLVEWSKSKTPQGSPVPDFRVTTLAAVPRIVSSLNSAKS